MIASKYDAGRLPKSTAAHDAIVITSIVFLLLLLIFSSGRGNGESERDRSLRVISQCRNAARTAEPAKNVTLEKIEMCDRLERAYRKTHGSSLG